MMKACLAVAAIAILATPAFAGEITGNGKPIEIHGESECAYSGLNDLPNSMNPMNPGGKVQSFGQLVKGGLDPRDPPTFMTPHGLVVLHPGFSCNPNGRD